jgi:ATP-dependent DNA helicase RecG
MTHSSLRLRTSSVIFAGSPMVRLLSGDVGAGKSGIAMMAAAMVAESRHQVLVLAPDYASAEQRFLFAEPRLQAAGITTRMVDSPNGALRDAIKRGDVQVVFGTVELLSSGLDFRRLGLVVAMERDDWGRTSALARALRPPRPDLLVVTSTPIGVSVALSAYSDHDITVVRSAPVTVRVDVHRGTGREDAYAAAAERVAAGEQALVVFPMVRGQDAFDAREAGPILRALSSEAFPDARVALFHGAASREERLETYRNFLHRRIDVLVATTHVEDMPRVPGATTVVVEQADRVPRPRLKCICAFVNGTGESHAHLVVSPKAEERTLFELSELFSQSTGAAVADAEVDMEGVSALTADDAFPAGHWTWLDPHEDRQLMLDAREAAHLLLREDPGLKRTENTRLATLARERWAKVWPDGPPCPIPEGAGSQRRRRRRRRRR